MMKRWVPLPEVSRPGMRQFVKGVTACSCDCACGTVAHKQQDIWHMAYGVKTYAWQWLLAGHALVLLLRRPAA